MPAADDAKTKSAPKKRSWLWVVGIVLAVAALLLPIIFYKPPAAELQVGSRTVALEIASTDAAREKGLGGRAAMANDHGMLFVFAQPNVACFWMKGMHFPLDMVWLDDGKKVVSIAKGVSPRTYPKSFCPSSPAQYVIELNAGQTAKLGVHTGQTLRF
jgi:uncharacterized membrane protein (UPF0127 family)